MRTSTLTHVLVRKISRSLTNCELLHLPRRELNLRLAMKQHEAYIAALRAAGVDLTILPEEPDLPDAVFVEDTVMMLNELAVICRLGRGSREPEAEKMAPVIAPLRLVLPLAPTE